MSKYEFTSETKEILISSRVVTLHRIRAVSDFGIVKAGDLGGWIEKEENLSHDGLAWVHNNAIVCDNAVVCDNADIFDNAKIYGNAKICDNTEVCDNAKIYGNAIVCNNACVYDNAIVCDNTIVSDNANVSDNARIRGNAMVYGNAKICGTAIICGDSRVSNDAMVSSVTHILVFGPVGSRYDFTTFYRDKDKEISVNCGCFNGKIDEFLEKVIQTHGNSRHALVYREAVKVAKLQIDVSL